MPSERETFRVGGERARLIPPTRSKPPASHRPPPQGGRGVGTIAITACVVFLLLVGAARAETPDEWVALGTRVHGFFGGFIPAGIRVGLDALDRLKAKPRGLTVTYWKGPKAVCPCVLDGVMLAVGSSPGQGTVTVAPEPAPDGDYAVIVIRDRKSGAGLKYTIAIDQQPKMLSWNKEPPHARYDDAMKAAGLFTVEPVAAK